MLSRSEIEDALHKWFLAWADYNLDGVTELFREEVLFENWTGAKTQGRESLRRQTRLQQPGGRAVDGRLPRFRLRPGGSSDGGRHAGLDAGAQATEGKSGAP
jgi:hypothetical protein